MLFPSYPELVVALLATAISLSVAGIVFLLKLSRVSLLSPEETALFNPSSLRELKIWLHEQGVDMSAWGTGSAKTSVDLWHEIQLGETKLALDPARRLVETVMVIVRDGDRILLETEQRMLDGRVRPRFWPPCEKLQQGETYLQAARRGLCEELELTADEITFLSDTYQISSSLKESASYPSLQADYRIHKIEAIIKNLPGGCFRTQERAAGHQEPTKQHIWEWLRPPADLLHFF